ncbi:MAG: cyclodeaminase/cyclohydrolase family protein [Clostridia bacterium]|nr:cyclodeaminase/cyclohydrolase family protein [Clostridia bacterium]
MKNMSIAEFAKATASGNPVPGGGSIAALCGSLAAALVEMVANLTEDNKKMIEIRKRMTLTRESLLDLIEKDSRAFTGVMEAYRMPKSSSEEKKVRLEAIQYNLIEAARVPMQTAELAFNIMEDSRKVVESGNVNAVTDGLVSAMMARTAVLASLLNVRTNLALIKDQNITEEMKKRADVLEKACRATESEILAGVEL